MAVRSGLLKDAQANYERELVAHAKDVEALNTSSRELEDLRASLADARQRLASEAAARESVESSAREVRANLERQVQEAERRVADLNKQNGLLHGQIERVNTELKRAQSAAVGLGSGLAAATEADASGLQRQLDDLREVVLFLRREKEIAEAKARLLVPPF